MNTIPWYLGSGYINLLIFLFTMGAVAATAFSFATRLKFPVAAAIFIIVLEIAIGLTISTYHKHWYDQKQCEYKLQKAETDTDLYVAQRVYCE